MKRKVIYESSHHVVLFLDYLDNIEGYKDINTMVIRIGFKEETETSQKMRT